MAFNPFLPNNGFPPLMPMSGLMQLGQLGVTVPTGVASVSAPPVRNILPDQPSLLGAYPGLPLPPPGMPFQPQFHLQQPQMLQVKKPPEPTGPIVTVFVGSITERAPDMLIRQLLSKCGSVNNWKRAQGANGKLQAFGFCDFSDPESAMRAIRILHEFEIADKKLVVKAGEQAKEQLLEYLKQKNPGAPASLDAEVDADTKRQDEDVRQQIINVLREHEFELQRDVDSSSRDRSKKSDRNRSNAADPKANEGIADIEMEEEKRSLIHREIDKFRDTYKASEEKREKDRREPSEKSDRSSSRRDDRRDRDRDRDRDDRSRRDRDRDGRSGKDNRRDRYGSRDRESARSYEDEEETYEKRRLERKLREKEASYQERLHNWESREKRKSKENYRDQEKEYQSKEEEAKEAKRLKQFLEDYDDDKDDSKFYKGSALSRRLRERKHEIEKDKQDEALERQEIEELKKKLREEGHPDPESEAAKRLNNSNDSESERERLVLAKLKELRNDAKSKVVQIEEDSSLGANSDSQPLEEMHVKSFSFTGMKLGNAPAAENHHDELKRKKMSEIFNANEDDELHSKKKRKLPTLADDNDSNHSVLSSGPKESKSSLSSEEKKKQIKNLIENIPTSKDELFKYEIEWSLVDNALMEKRIRPWINKKITEYIGEEEQALLDFICSKINAKSSAESILNDVAMVLDEEAEVFVVKMWRLLIYEIEAKKLGLAK